jgi:hypothetical protein
MNDNILAINAINTAIAEIESALTEVGYIDGEPTTEAQVEAESKIMFWRTSCKSNSGKNKNIYIVYYDFNSPVSERADNKDRAREVGIGLDYFSKYNFNDYRLVTSQQLVERKLKDLGWEVELSNKDYDSDSDSYSLNYSLYKKFR